MYTILIKMFNGFIIHESSWDGEGYTKTMDQAMIEACDGDEIEGQMIACFAHWSNDIQSLAPYFGVALQRDENDKLFVNENVPTGLPNQYWANGQWNDWKDEEE